MARPQTDEGQLAHVLPIYHIAAASETRSAADRKLSEYEILLLYQDMTSWYRIKIWPPGTVRGYHIVVPYQDIISWYGTRISYWPTHVNCFRK